jgi:hypothetical protein
LQGESAFGSLQYSLKPRKVVFDVGNALSIEGGPIVSEKASFMRILVIGGTRFMGPHINREVDPSAITENSPLRTKLYPFRSETARPKGDLQSWLDHCEKILGSGNAEELTGAWLPCQMPRTGWHGYPLNTEFPRAPRLAADARPQPSARNVRASC